MYWSDSPAPAQQFLEPTLAPDQRQVAQIVAVMLDQVEGVQKSRLPLKSRWKSRIPVELKQNSGNAVVDLLNAKQRN